MQLPGEDADDLVRDDKVAALLAPFVAWADVEIERKTVYAFHARVADRWRSGRIFLAGDAAHLMPPFAGQGMNGGMKDAANLAWKLASVLAGNAPAEILDTYEAERAEHLRGMVKLSRRLGAVIMPTNRAMASLRDSAFACLNLSSDFRTFVRQGGLIPPPHISRSALTASGKGKLIGQMLPPEVLSTDGRAPLDRFLSCHQWMALGVGVDPASAMSGRDRSILDALGARFICLNGRAGSARTLSLRCDDQNFAGWTKRHAVEGVLVRPDRFIAERLRGSGDLQVLARFSPSRAPAPERVEALQH